MPTFVTTGPPRTSRAPGPEPTPAPPTASPPTRVEEEPARTRSRRKSPGSLTTSAEVLTAFTPTPTASGTEPVGDDLEEKEVDA